LISRLETNIQLLLDSAEFFKNLKQLDGSPFCGTLHCETSLASLFKLSLGWIDKTGACNDVSQQLEVAHCFLTLAVRTSFIRAGIRVNHWHFEAMLPGVS
jgi:hypothetical protein